MHLFVGCRHGREFDEDQTHNDMKCITHVCILFVNDMVCVLTRGHHRELIASGQVVTSATWIMQSVENTTFRELLHF